MLLAWSKRGDRYHYIRKASAFLVAVAQHAWTAAEAYIPSELNNSVRSTSQGYVLHRRRENCSSTGQTYPRAPGKVPGTCTFIRLPLYPQLPDQTSGPLTRRVFSAANLGCKIVVDLPRPRFTPHCRSDRRSVEWCGRDARGARMHGLVCSLASETSSAPSTVMRAVESVCCYKSVKTPCLSLMR